MSTEIRVALVYQQEEGTGTLRTALANAGVQIAMECKADALTDSGLLKTEVDAIVVNLDPELEELLDEVTEALDQASQPVIYNDPAASSDLSGWDRARWLRHLSAKLKGRSDVTPPAPVGSQAIPSPIRKAPVAAVVAAPVAAVAAVVATPPAPEPPQAAPIGTRKADTAQSIEHVSLDLGFLDVAPDTASPAESLVPRSESSFEWDAPAASTPEPARSTTAAPAAPADSLADFGDLDSLFDEIPSFASSTPAASAPAPAPEPASEFSFDSLMLPDTIEMAVPDALRARPAPPANSEEAAEFSMDALFSESAEIDIPSAVPIESAAPAASDADFFMDGLFDTDGGTPALAHAESSPAPGAGDDGLADLDALFRDFETNQSTAPNPAAEPAATPQAASTMKKVEAKSAPMDWSLEPGPEPAAKPVVPDRAVAEWRLDGGPAPRPVIVDKGPIGAPTAKPSGPALPADLEASLALADLKLLDDDFSLDAPAPAAPPRASEGRSDFNRSSMDLDSPLSLMDDLPASSPSDSISEHALSLAELDFALDLGDLVDNDDAKPVSSHGGSSTQSFDAGLDDLDSLFEPVSAAPVVGIKLPDLNRVFVLGASIGGPEAIKTFLGKLPDKTPAAFIIAQHMGAEFLEMMALQLDAATALSVRCPKTGERVRHGDVLVAPVGEQLSIDEKGIVRLSATTSGSPYNPSIDQLVHDAADRFGDHATLILFSGMGSDAIEGGRYLTERGGQVWAQDPASCVISSMIDAAKAQSLVRFEGTPAQLAERVTMTLG